MKKIFALILTSVALIGAAASCSLLDSESPSTFDDKTVYSNYDLTQFAIYGITEVFAETNCYRGRFLPFYGFNTDTEWYNTFKAGDAKYEIAAYSLKSNNSQLNNSNGPYNTMVAGVERANLAIQGIRNYGNPDKNAGMAYLLGEALTLRAMIYYDIVKAWGDVPARFTPTGTANAYMPKSSRDVIYKQILSDLEEAITYLPYPGTTDATKRTDRINKVFAEGLYARIALAAAGYALRPADGAVGTGDLGEIRLSSDPELSKEALYPVALGYLEDAIEHGGCSLAGDYEAYWKKQSNCDNLDFDGETLYVIPFSNTRGRWNYTFAVKVEKYNVLGYTIDQGGQVGPTPTMFFRYDPLDTRRDVTCVNYSVGSEGPELAGIHRWYFGKYRFNWMTSNPYTGGNDDGVKPVVMRYSDILLMAAELANWNNDLTGARAYLQQVRERAFTGNEDVAENYVQAIADKDAMYEAILEERALEFCGEFLRKADLIRWNRLKSSLDDAIADMKSLRTLSGKYAFLTGDVWFGDGDDEYSLSVYGLSPDENVNPGSGWTASKGYVNKYDDSKNTGFYNALIESIYETDPDTRQFWPIFDNTVSNSQGYIKNDYGY